MLCNVNTPFFCLPSCPYLNIVEQQMHADNQVVCVVRNCSNASLCTNAVELYKRSLLMKEK